MKLNDAVAKVYAFLNKIALNIPIVSKLFKNRTAETSTAETTVIETVTSETNPADFKLFRADFRKRAAHRRRAKNQAKIQAPPHR